MLAQRNYNSSATEEVRIDPEELGEAGAAGDPQGADQDGRPASHRSIEEYSTTEIGREGEAMAASLLERRGYEIICRNWRCDFGEVDIVARDHEEAEVVLVEVKTRLALGAEADLAPEIAVDRRKQTRYKKLALLYLAHHPELISVRFDVVAVNIVGYHQARLRHLSGAYAWDENR